MMDWVLERMHLVRMACEDVSENIGDLRISICFPLEYKTAVLIYELSKYCMVKACMFDDATTKFDAVEWLKKHGIEIAEKEECLDSEYYMDCVATLTRLALKRLALKKQKLQVKGILELTRSGVSVLEKLNRSGEYNSDLIPKTISIDDSVIKGEGENIYGTGMGLLDALLRLNIHLPGKKVFIIGFGRVGEGCAEMLRKIGCYVYVTDRDSLRCALAEYRGFEVVDVENGLSSADIVVTATGTNGIINSKNSGYVKSGAVLCNMGAARYEIDVRDLVKLYRMKHFDKVTKFYNDSSHFYVLADGEAANLTMGNGTPIEIMDRTFALTIFGLEYLVKNDFDGIMKTPHEVERRLADLLKRSVKE
jgi:adenosylhomocysteinase